MKQKLTIFICTLGLFLPLLYVSAGTVLSSHKYAWSNNVGYINFENVTVSDSDLSGYAWSANKGFIKFNPAQGGVFNDGTGNLSGSAWGEQLGWIDFNNVNINGSGKFTGTAEGSLVGTITFDCSTYCDVQTDWRPATSTSAPPPSGAGGEGGGGNGSPIQNPISAEPTQDLIRSAQAKLIDIQKDGTINILDFNTMMANWGSEVQGNGADMNRDGTVDVFDFNVLMVYWGTTYLI